MTDAAYEPDWDTALDTALATHDAIRDVVQPIADLQRGGVVGYEMLARFAGPPDATRTGGSPPRNVSGGVRSSHGGPSNSGCNGCAPCHRTRS